MSNKYGPNVTRLILEFIARETVPPGGGIENVLEFFQNKELRKTILDKAENSALAYIILLREAPDNTWGDDDEVIAGELLKKIKERRQEQRSGKIG